MPTVHQLLAGFRPYDAISEEALVLRDLFRSWGFASDIFTEPARVPPPLRKAVRDAADCARFCRGGDVALLHLSIGSDVNDLFAALPCRKAILYHNITPPGYFAAVNPATARDLERGLRQARALAGAAAVNMADSSFNAAALAGWGYGDVRVLPLLLRRERLRGPADTRAVRALSDGMFNVLFVGRCAPNKRIEHVIQVCALLQAASGARVRFVHAGSWGGTERYYHALAPLARDLGLAQAVFAGHVADAQLAALYRSAGVFLCMSEHEGFCAPVLESMARDLPVAALAAGAVPETMDGAGILFGEPRFDLVAETLARLAADPRLREAVVAGQRDRIARFEKRDAAGEVRRHLAPLLE
jgi:glycosyltransferase involved in cell wall biosynthesis